MAETDSKEVEKDIVNGNKDSGGGKSSQPKMKLSANAPVFDVSRSPTLDPYAGPNGIRTLPANVPPATIPPPQQQQANQQQAQQQQQQQSNQGQQQQQLTAQQAQAQQAQQQQHLSRSRHTGQPRQGYPQPYDQHAPERDRRNMSYPPNHQNQMAPQHMRHPQQYPPQMGGHQRYPNPNYPPNYPANRGPHPVPPHDYRPHPQQMMNRHPNQPYGHRHPQNPIHPPPPHGGAQYMQPPGPQQNGSSTQQPSNQQLASPPQQQTNGATSNNNNNASTNNNNNNNTKNASNTQQSSNALNGTSNTNGSTSKQQSSGTTTTATTATATPAVKPGKVQFKTFTHQKNARPVGSTMAYKHPSRSHYGQPDAKLRDPKFTNPENLLHLQRWELLESAKRWLPGEGTQITWKNHRYLIGPPIHMGMNGHIHYCYKYPIPKDQRTSKKDRKKNEKKNGASDKDQKEKTDKDEEQDDESDDEPDIIDIDITSPCVETLAAKIVPNTPAFAREIVILRALQDCENVTELYDVLESERTLISILELAQADVYNFFVGRGSTRHGWNLDKPAVREHFSKMVISNVVQGLDQMHNVKGGGYLHCDLKSLNILLYIYVTDHSNRRGGVYIKAKLTDFGHSSHGTTRIAEKLFSNGMARVGTAGHVAPELFKEGTKCSEKIDIWSLGIVMFSMLVPGRLLFSEYTNLDALKRGYDRLNKMNPWSRDRPSWWTDFERLSPEARDLILWMTRYDPNQRPTCQQILKHPWFLIGKAGHREHYRPSLKYVDMLCSSSIAQE